MYFALRLININMFPKKALCYYVILFSACYRDLPLEMMLNMCSHIIKVSLGNS